MLENNIKNLIKILEESTINEMEISTFWGKDRIRIKKNDKNYADKNINIIKEDSSKPDLNTLDSSENIVKRHESEIAESSEQILNDPTQQADSISIKAPLVGTFYRSAKPGDPAFISEGDTIKEGQVICIIEAMKIFNEIESDYSGTVKHILIEDGTPVEYDQELIVISTE